MSHTVLTTTASFRTTERLLPSTLADGAYNVYYWERQTTAVSEGVLHVKNGKATELFNSVFSLKEVQAAFLRFIRSKRWT